MSIELEPKNSGILTQAVRTIGASLAGTIAMTGAAAQTNLPVTQYDGQKVMVCEFQEGGLKCFVVPVTEAPTAKSGKGFTIIDGEAPALIELDPQQIATAKEQVDYPPFPMEVFGTIEYVKVKLGEPKDLVPTYLDQVEV